MITHDKKQLIREKLKSLAAWHAAAAAQIEDTMSFLSQMLDLEEQAELAASLGPDDQHTLDTDSDAPIADRTTLSILWRGRTCFLGNTVPFRFFERLARSPDQFVSYEDLLDDVWGGPRENGTIRGAAKRLRDRLTECDMAEVAGSVDGSSSSHYRLISVAKK